MIRADSAYRPQPQALELTLSHFSTLSAEAISFVRAAVAGGHFYRAGSELKIAAGQAKVLMSGWVALVAALPDGRRQVISIALPGELLSETPSFALDLTLMVLLDSHIADCADLCEQAEEPTPQLNDLATAWSLAKRDSEARTIRHIVRLGRLAAYERMASFIVELHERLQRSGSAEANAMPMPLTQEVLADCLGLSVVHVNRTLQQLRRDGLIAYRSGRMLFPDLAKLQDAAAC